MATAIQRELELVGSFRFNDEIDHVLRALADDSLDVNAVITHEYDIGDALTALRVAADPICSGKVLLTFAGTATANTAYREIRTGGHLGYTPDSSRPAQASAAS